MEALGRPVLLICALAGFTLLQHADATCAKNTNVACPGSGNMCMGDQCCPGFSETNGLTFACPSASLGFSGCQNNTKTFSCRARASVLAASPAPLRAGATCAKNANVACPGSGNMCMGDQCCPGFSETNGLTFPCPSASLEFSGCRNNTKAFSCLPEPPADVCAWNANVACPGSGNMCMGDQCCPGFSETNGLTFACPSASLGFSGCQNNTKAFSCRAGGHRLSSP